MRASLLLLLAALTACGRHGSALPYYRSAAMTPEWLSIGEANVPSMHRVGPFRVVDQSGRQLSDSSLAGKVTIAHFFFTRCGDVCPTTTKSIARVLRQIPKDARLQVFSYSVVPEADSVAALRHYADMHGITDPRWHLLTGPANVVAGLARDSYFVRLGDGTTYGVTSIAHTESLVLVDGQGRLRGVYAGTLPLEMQRLREDAEALLRASGERREAMLVLPVPRTVPSPGS